MNKEREAAMQLLREQSEEKMLKFALQFPGLFERLVIAVEKLVNNKVIMRGDGGGED